MESHHMCIMFMHTALELRQPVGSPPSQIRAAELWYVMFY